MQSIMRKGWSYIKGSQDFINKSRKLGKIPDNAILVTTSIVGFYPSISQNVGPRALKEALGKREHKKISYRGPLASGRVCFEKYFF